MVTCDADETCDCVTYDADSKTCWKRASCVPEQFERDSASAPYTVYVKNRAPPPPPKKAGGALAYLKHDSLGPRGDACIMIFNPGAAQMVTLDLALLPPSLTGGGIVPYDLFTNESAAAPLSHSWSVNMGLGEARAFGGFSLGVFAPRRGKVSSCRSNYNHTMVTATTLQSCFLACAKNSQCENVIVHGPVPNYLEAPGPMSCTLLGPVPEPSTMCTPAATGSCNGKKKEGTFQCATLIRELPHGRPSA